MTGSEVKIAIAGAGVSGFATLGYLVEHLRKVPSAETVIYLLQPPKRICADGLTQAQRDRLAKLREIGIDPSRLLGGGEVYHPAQPSLFTFNGNSAARGFNFVRRRYDFEDYFEWVQANRALLASLYPDFAPEQKQQRHSGHTLDEIEGTTPRGAYGLYLNEQFLALQKHLPEHVRLQVVPEAMTASMATGQTVTVETGSRQFVVDYLVDATGHRYVELRPEWAGRVFKAYPCDRYSQNLAKEITVVGAGPAGIEVALHALHNLDVERVALVSRSGRSRLPQVEPTEAYECQWFTREKMRENPTAAYAEALLERELEACCQACNLFFPGWEALLQVEDYADFLADYLKITARSPNHPLAHLVRPVMSFYGQVKDLLAPAEQVKVQQLIARVRPLFATQSRPCAEMMLAAIEAGRLELIAGEFLFEEATPTVLRPDGTQIHPECVVLATGLAPSIPAVSLQNENSRCYQVVGTSLSEVHKGAAEVAEFVVFDMLAWRARSHEQRLLSCISAIAHTKCGLSWCVSLAYRS